MSLPLAVSKIQLMESYLRDRKQREWLHPPPPPQLCSPPGKPAAPKTFSYFVFNSKSSLRLHADDTTHYRTQIRN